MFEDVKGLPFNNLINLNGLDTNTLATLPGGGPEREVARRWRYALAGAGAGWAFTAEEQQRWGGLATDGSSLGARGEIDVVAQGPNLNVVQVTITFPGLQRPVTLTTIVSRW
jgi:hypothetical protein